MVIFELKLEENSLKSLKKFRPSAAGIRTYDLRRSPERKSDTLCITPLRHNGVVRNQSLMNHERSCVRKIKVVVYV